MKARIVTLAIVFVLCISAFTAAVSDTPRKRSTQAVDLSQLSLRPDHNQSGLSADGKVFLRTRRDTAANVIVIDRMSISGPDVIRVDTIILERGSQIVVDPLTDTYVHHTSRKLYRYTVADGFLVSYIPLQNAENIPASFQIRQVRRNGACVSDLLSTPYETNFLQVGSSELYMSRPGHDSLLLLLSKRDVGNIHRVYFSRANARVYAVVDGQNCTRCEVRSFHAQSGEPGPTYSAKLLGVDQIIIDTATGNFMSVHAFGIDLVSGATMTTITRNTEWERTVRPDSVPFKPFLRLHLLSGTFDFDPMTTRTMRKLPKGAGSIAHSGANVRMDESRHVQIISMIANETYVLPVQGDEVFEVYNNDMSVIVRNGDDYIFVPRVLH